MLFFAGLPGQSAHQDENAIGALIYFADSAAAHRYGRSITGSTYCVAKGGPMPAELPQTILNLDRARDVESQRVLTHTSVYTAIYAQRGYDANVFDEDELAVMIQVQREAQGWSADQVAEAARARIPGARFTPYGMVSDWAQPGDEFIPQRQPILA